MTLSIPGAASRDDLANAGSERSRQIGPLGEAVVVGVLVLSLYLLRSLYQFMQVGAFNDDGVYVALGKAISEGRGYVSIHLAGSPVHPKFPPVFPLILAALWKLSGTLDGVQHAVGIIHSVVAAATAAVLWWLGRARLKAQWPVLLLCVTTMFLFDAAIQYYTIPLSEPWFMLGWAIVLVLWNSAECLDGTRRVAFLALAGFMIAVTVLVRSQGIVLVPAAAVALARPRYTSRERAATVVAILVPLVLWHFYHGALLAHGPNSNLPDDVTYNTWLTQGGSGIAGILLHSVRINLMTYCEQFGMALSDTPVTGKTTASLMIAIAFIGSIGVTRRQPLLGTSTLSGLILLLFWPFAQDRLMLSLLPFAGLSFAVWVSPYVARLSRDGGKLLGAFATALAIIFVVGQGRVRTANVEAYRESRIIEAWSPGYVLLRNSAFIANESAWVRENTSPSDRIMIDNHPGIFLNTGRQTMPVNPSESRLQKSVFSEPGHYLASHILSDSLTYLIIGLPTRGILSDVTAVSRQCPGVLTLIGDSGQPMMKIRRDEKCLSRIL
jgi:hypothetical protein